MSGRMPVRALIWPLCLLAVAGSAEIRAEGPEAKIVERPLDPHGTPRPARNATEVPPRTSLYLELAAPKGSESTAVDPSKVSITIQAEGGEPLPLISDVGKFAEGARGWLRPAKLLSGSSTLGVYVETGRELAAGTRHTVKVSVGGSDAGSWAFTTEAAPTTHPVAFTLDLGAKPVQWHGRFFSGLCNVLFSSDAESHKPTYDLMLEARSRHPRAWDYQRDFWMTGTDFRPGGLMPQRLPNIVREVETRQIAAIEPGEGETVLRVEDVFGHEQYGVPAGRPLSGDFHPGDEVLIADGIHDARAKVIAVDDAARTVRVSTFPEPKEGWKIAYEGPLPTEENPDAPGLFAPGGCYLRKFNPVGTPCYYWGRLDKEWDLLHNKYKRRLMVNFADATGDLAIDGRSWTTAKDLAQWHEVVRAITGHIIDRYGDDALGFTWSVFNEPDLGVLFWRADWEELQRFYDYTTDGILRAFEDRGYDSNKVFVGGLELGAIFGTNLKLKEFLAHCSPRADAMGALPKNAAVADKRLDGKRSKRVEDLCRASGGKGSPCDFVSIHSYNRSEVMANKLIRAKEMALEIDAEYYRDLWVNSHESCPDWAPPPDEAAVDSYLGNGYFPTWCLDVVHRQLLRAAEDPRYARGETILTVWPPPSGLSGINAITRNLSCDDDGDGRGDRKVTIPMPIFHALGLLSDLGDAYWVLPLREVSGRRVGGFASRDEAGVVRLLLFAHGAQDTQSRSAATFDVVVDLAGAGAYRMEEFRFDRDHNSPFDLIQNHKRAMESARAGEPDAALVAALTKALAGDDAEAQRKALLEARKVDRDTLRALAATVWGLAGSTKDKEVREAATTLLREALGPEALPRELVEGLIDATLLRVTSKAELPPDAQGHSQLKARLASNGCAFLVLTPAK